MRASGAAWEALARTHLERAGLVTLACNYTCRYGELDLVMRERDTIVFVEVRYRAGGGFGDGLDSISARKCLRLQRAAASFLQSHAALAAAPCRFDVLALSGAGKRGRRSYR